MAEHDEPAPTLGTDHGLSADGLPPKLTEDARRRSQRLAMELSEAQRIPDGDERTVRIPVAVRNGVTTFLYDDQPLPLKDTLLGHLVVDAAAVEDPFLLHLFQEAHTVELQPRGGRVVMQMKPQHPLAEKLHLLACRKGVLGDLEGFFVEVITDEPLRLYVRGTKQSSLARCACHIPALRNKAAISLNQAYSLISAVYEPQRKAHVGNVFAKGLCWDTARGEWSVLNQLRDHFEKLYEVYIQEQLTRRLKDPQLVKPQPFRDWMYDREQPRLFP